MNHNFLSHIAQNLQEYIPGEQPQGKEWIKLNTNEFPYPPSSLVQDELKEIGINYEILKKYPHPLSEPLRSQLASKWNVDPEDVLVTNGSDEALMLIARSIFSEGEFAAFPQITYTLYTTILASIGAKFQQIKMMPDHRIDLEALHHSQAKGVFLANPNAITGEYIDSSRLQQYFQKSNKIWIIDEAYIDFAQSKRASFLNQLSQEQNVIVVQTFSKAYGLAGLRIGYAISKNKALMKILYQIKDSYNQDRIAIRLASRALEDTNYYQKKIAEIKVQRKFLTEELQNRNFFVMPSHANFILAKPEKKTASQIYQELKEKKILVRYYENSLLSDHIRITIGSPQENHTLLQQL